MAQAESRAQLPTRLIVGLILGAALLIAVSFAVGRISVPAETTPSSTSAEAGFARDMQTHHQQAVEMAMIIRDKAQDPDIRSIAYDIATTQAQQAGQMYGWLTLWGLPQAAPEPSMTWMERPVAGGGGHAHGAASTHVPGGPMPGLATDAQLAELKSLSGADAENLFLHLMIAHHRGGIEMAEAVLDRSTNPMVESLAGGMAKAQQSEIDYMEGLLAQRGA